MHSKSPASDFSVFLNNDGLLYDLKLSGIEFHASDALYLNLPMLCSMLLLGIAFEDVYWCF